MFRTSSTTRRRREDEEEQDGDTDADNDDDDDDDDDGASGSFLLHSNSCRGSKTDAVKSPSDMLGKELVLAEAMALSESLSELEYEFEGEPEEVDIAVVGGDLKPSESVSRVIRMRLKCLKSSSCFGGLDNEDFLATVEKAVVSNA